MWGFACEVSILIILSRYAGPKDLTVIEWMIDLGSRMKQLQTASKVTNTNGAKELKNMQVKSSFKLSLRPLFLHPSVMGHRIKPLSVYLSTLLYVSKVVSFSYCIFLLCFVLLVSLLSSELTCNIFLCKLHHSRVVVIFRKCTSPIMPIHWLFGHSSSIFMPTISSKPISEHACK